MADMNALLWKMDDLMARLQRLMMFHATIATEKGLTASQIFILRYLEKCPQAKASDIAKIAGLSPGAVTQVCDELVKMAYVERSRSTDDRRVVHTTLTAAGRKQLDEIRQQRIARMMDIVKQLDAEEATAFVGLLGRVVEVAEKDFTNLHA